MSCPKCGYSTMVGPRYSNVDLSGTISHECLIYTCLQCGYRFATPTVDKAKDALVENLLKQFKEGKKDNP